MMNMKRTALWTATAVAVVMPLFAACDAKKELLEPQQPGVISPGDIQNATGAEALYVGALSFLLRSAMSRIVSKIFIVAARDFSAS